MSGFRAKIYGEIVGFATNCDASHITNPSSEHMEKCMRMALSNAGLKPEDIGYVNAHGTGTSSGDIAESTATFRVFGKNVPVSTLKREKACRSKNYGHEAERCAYRKNVRMISSWLDVPGFGSVMYILFSNTGKRIHKNLRF